MKIILLLRHAKSAWGQPGLDDHERPLNRRGERAAEAMAEHIVHQRAAPRFDPVLHGRADAPDPGAAGPPADLPRPADRTGKRPLPRLRGRSCWCACGRSRKTVGHGPADRPQRRVSASWRRPWPAAAERPTSHALHDEISDRRPGDLAGAGAPGSDLAPGSANSCPSSARAISCGSKTFPRFPDRERPATLRQRILARMQLSGTLAVRKSATFS